MAIARFSLSEMSQLGPDEKKNRLAQLAAARKQPLNGEVAVIDAQIAEYEARYEMSSETMIERFRQNEVRETADIGSWMILLDVRKRLSRVR